MPNVDDLLNTPVELELAGKPFQVRRVPLVGLVSKFKAAIKQERIAAAKDLASDMEPAERRAFMVDMLPTIGQSLDEEAWGMFVTPDGVVEVLKAALKADQPEITDEEIQVLMQVHGYANLVPICEWLAGMNDQPPGAEKKTETTDGTGPES